MNEQQTVKYRTKAVASHQARAGVFADRYKTMATDSYANAFVYGRKKLFAFLFQFLKQNTPTSGQILDVGCGTGYLLNQLKNKGYKVIGVEPAPAMREQVIKLYPDIKVIPGSVIKLDFPNEQFDIVLAIEVFRYLSKDDILAGYAECLRVLKPGGYFISTLVNRYALDGFIILYYSRWLLEKLFHKPMDNYCDFVTPQSIKKLFKNNFNLPVETYGVLFSPWRLIYKINGRLGKLLAKKLERFDNLLSRKNWWQPLAGHLLIIVKKQ